MKRKHLIFVISIYVLSAIHNWFWWHKDLSQGGEDFTIKTSFYVIATLTTFVPIINIVAVFSLEIINPMFFLGNVDKVFDLK